MTKKVLIVGTSSFVGSNLAYYLRQHYRVYGTYATHRPQIDRITPLSFLIKRGAPISDLLGSVKPDVVVYCAAITNEELCHKNPMEALLVNSEAAGLFAQASTANGGRFIYISTSKVFDGDQGNYSEEDRTTPISIYGDSKLKGEERVGVYENVFILRVGTLFGYGSHTHRTLFRRILRQALDNKKMQFIDDEWRSFLSVQEFSKIVGTIIDTQEKNRGTYHISNGEKYTYHSFATLFANTFDIPLNLILPLSGERFSHETNFGGLRGKDLSLNPGLFQQTFVGQVVGVAASLSLLRHQADFGEI